MEEKVFVSAPLNCLRCLRVVPSCGSQAAVRRAIILNNEPICIHLLNTGTAGIAFRYICAIQCLPVNVGKITVQLAACQQNVVTYPVILLQIPQMPLSPYADIRRSFFGQFQAGKIGITLHFIPKPVFLVLNVLVHFVILQ